MQPKRIFEMAKEVNIPIVALMEKLKKLGFSPRSHLSVATPEMELAITGRPSVQSDKEASKPEPGPTKPLDVEADQKVDGSVVEEVIFFSPSRCHDIAYKKEVYFPGTPKIKEAAQSIRFDDYEYRTSDPEKIEFIKSTRSFKVRSTSYPNGKIRIVTEGELGRLKMARQPKVTEIKSTGQDKLAGDDVDMSRLGAIPESIG